MNKRQLGQSGLYVSEMGLGCMSLGTDEKKAASILSEALDSGINYFDTADLYDFGVNEEIVGKVLKPHRNDIILATKAGNRWNEEKTSWNWDPSKAYIKQAVKDSLRRLQTDYIDLYQLHGGTLDDPIDETIEAFEELKQEGLIRAYGISSIRPNVIHEYVQRSGIVSNMMQYSLLDRRPEEWFSLLEGHHVSVIARGPLAKGLLSEKMLAKASSKVREEGYLDYSYQELEELLSSIKETLAERTMNEIAFQYVLSSPAVAAVIPGASSPEQLCENAAAIKSKPLSEKEIGLLRSLTKMSKYEAHRV
ncbi:aldo/keto reductase [Gracilibacillus sp. Marseille-QA3620]